MAEQAAAKGIPAGTVQTFEAPKPRAAAMLRRLARNRMLLAWSIILLGLILMAVFAPAIAPYDPIKQSADLLQPPSGRHLFGTDELGRDVLSRIIYGARISLTVGLIAVGIAGSIGTIIGLISGFLGGAVDNITMRIIDVLMAFPGIILAILIMATLGASLVNVMIAVGISAIPWYARTVRGATLAVRENDYSLSARALGATPGHIMVRHVLPNVIGPVVVLASLAVDLLYGLLDPRIRLGRTQ